MKKLPILFFLIYYLMFPLFVFAQSNTATTRVGNPQTNSTILSVARDIKSAYDKCSGGETWEKAGLSDCLAEELLAKGYGQDVVSAFKSRQQGSYADGCTQCVGFVAITLALMTGRSDPLYGFNNASEIARLDSIRVGNIEFRKIPSGEAPQEGDIGAYDNGNGHILIVSSVEKGGVFFNSVEANAGGFECQVTDGARRRARDTFVFFRKI